MICPPWYGRVYITRKCRRGGAADETVEPVIVRSQWLETPFSYIAAVAVGDYHKPEAFLMVVSRGFKTREIWTVLSRKCESASWGVAVGCQTAVVIAEVS